MDTEFFKALGIVCGLGVLALVIAPPIVILLMKYVNWLGEKFDI